MEHAYIQYYTVQTGTGLKDIGPLYHNLRFIQHGSGFGSFFGSLYRFLKPLIYSGMDALQHQAVKTGTNILSELGSRPFNEIISDHGKKATEELKSKFKKKFQSGSGLIFSGAAVRNSLKKKKKSIKINKKQKNIKGKKNIKTRQSNSKRKKVNTHKKKKLETRVLDIFSKNKKLQ